MIRIMTDITISRTMTNARPEQGVVNKSNWDQHGIKHGSLLLLLIIALACVFGPCGMTAVYHVTLGKIVVKWILALCYTVIFIGTIVYGIVKTLAVSTAICYIVGFLASIIYSLLRTKNINGDNTKKIFFFIIPLSFLLGPCGMFAFYCITPGETSAAILTALCYTVGFYSSVIFGLAQMKVLKRDKTEQASTANIRFARGYTQQMKVKSGIKEMPSIIEE
jgi:hypothetical protein